MICPQQYQQKSLMSINLPKFRKKSIRFNTMSKEEPNVRARVQSLSEKKLPSHLHINKIKRNNTEGVEKVHQQFHQQFHQEENKVENLLTNKLKLSPVKQYETKIKISAESWLIYDYRKDSYKRGWRPSDVGDFNGLVRLLVLRVFCRLLDQNPQLNAFTVRINTLYLKEEIELAKQARVPLSKKKGLIYRQSISRALQNSNDEQIYIDSVINIVDLLHGLMMTNHDDLVEYCIIFVGYLCFCRNPMDPQNSTQAHSVQKVGEAITYAQYFADYVTAELFPLLEMVDSSFQALTYTFRSSANDICRLYLSIEENTLFKSIMSCQELSWFKYWENRLVTFRNRRINMGDHYYCTMSWRGKKNFSVLCRNTDLNVLIILQDVKYGMTECDIGIIERWARGLRKPIVEQRRTHVKLLPLLRLSEVPSPTKKLQRSETQA